MKNSINNAKNFGFLISFLLFFYFIYTLFVHDKNNYVLLLSAAILVILSKFQPKILLPFSFIWIMIGVLGNKLISPIVVGILFFLIVTPTSIIRKIFVNDPLNIKFDKNKPSYWHPADKNIQTFDNQF